MRKVQSIATHTVKKVMQRGEDSFQLTTSNDAWFYSAIISFQIKVNEIDFYSVTITTSRSNQAI